MSLRRKTLLYLPSLKYKSVTFPYILTSILLQSITVMCVPEQRTATAFFAACIISANASVYAISIKHCGTKVQLQLHLRPSWFGSIHSLHFSPFHFHSLPPSPSLSSPYSGHPLSRPITVLWWRFTLHWTRVMADVCVCGGGDNNRHAQRERKQRPERAHGRWLTPGDSICCF